MTHRPSGSQVSVVGIKPVRWPVAIVATASSSSIGHRAAFVSDLSRTGCRMELQCRFAQEEFVMLTIPSFQPMGATAIWSDGTATGLRFISPISATVLRAVAARHRRPGPIDF